MTTSTTWTYGGYWTTVLGGGSAARVVDEFCLNPGDRRGLDEWLGRAETDAWMAGAEGRDGEPMPAEWQTFHARALDEMCAVEVAS